MLHNDIQIRDASGDGTWRVGLSGPGGLNIEVHPFVTNAVGGCDSL